MIYRDVAVVVAPVLVGVCAIGAAAQPRPAQLEIDATDLPRHLLYATMVIPLEGELATDAADGEVALWYPKWVAGSHAPGGPAQNIAGLSITDQANAPVEWSRTPGEMHRIIAQVPAGTTELIVWIRYITDQPGTNSHGLDSFGSESLGIISPNTVLVYPESVEPTAWQVATTLRLPEGWDAATALHRDAGANAAETDGGAASAAPVVHYQATTLELLVDSPIMAGRHSRAYRLNQRAREDDPATPPHRLHVFSESPDAVEVNEEVLDNYRDMVTQATRLFGSHPFESMDILLATTNDLPRNGLEHLRTTLNVIPLGALESTRSLNGWDRMLVPHEYVHAWCGKYRRPAGMVTGDFHTPQDTELLWVYEGLTQYLGTVLEVRAGMMSPEEYEWNLIQRIRWARHQQGREWRTIADTGAAAHSLRAGSPMWGHLRRSQDYYEEGSLIWLEADAIIRRLSDGERSLDDFCRAFFACGEGDPVPKPFTREEVVATLRTVADHDWDAFIRERVETPGAGVDGVIEELGYRVRYTGQPHGDQPGHSFDELDAKDSLGMQVGDDGRIDTVLLGTPADEAGLGPRMRIIGVGDHLWSRARFAEALRASRRTGEVTLLLAIDDRLVTKRIEYRDGMRFMTLERGRGRENVLQGVLRGR